MHPRVVAAMVAWFLLAEPVLAEPMQLDDPRPRWVQVEFEVSPSDAPGRLDSTYTKKALAWLEPAAEPGYAQVTVKLQTHRVLAITWSDVELARKIHEVVTWLPADDDALEGFPKKWVR